MDRGQGGDQRGEVCIAFNPRSVQVKQAQGRWKIADGNSRICYVGRPNPATT